MMCKYEECRIILFGDDTDDENDEDRRAAFFVLKRE